MSIESEANESAGTSADAQGTPAGDDDAALYEAAAAAWGDGPHGEEDDAVEADGEPGDPAAAAPAPKRGKPADADGEADDAAPPMTKAAKLAAFLDAKAAEHRGRSDYERRAAELEAERARLAEQRAAADGEVRRARETLEAQARRLREDPVAAARELGVSPDELMAGATRELSPEARVLAEVRTVKAQLEAARAEYEARASKLEEMRRADEARLQAQARSHEENGFIAQASEAAPTATLLWSDRSAILREAYSVIQRVTSMGQPPPSNADILEYLEYKATQEVARIRGQAAASVAAPPASSKSSGHPLSAKRTSERRSAPPRYQDLSADEQDAELVRVAAMAMRGSSAKPPAPKR